MAAVGEQTKRILFDTPPARGALTVKDQGPKHTTGDLKKYIYLFIIIQESFQNTCVHAHLN